MIRGLSYDQLVETLIKDDKNVLILDTCCLLDIIRCLPREKMDVFDSALNISNAIKEGTLNFSIVLPSSVPKEWNDNIGNVAQETEKFINKQFNSLRDIGKIVVEISPDMAFAFGAFNKLQIEQELGAISRRIMDSGYTCETKDEIELRAVKRVRNSIPPSSKGKDSTIDCIIYEEVLHISKLLRNVDFDKKIIFASSNTKEYYIDDSLHPSIKEELDERKVEFVASLNWAESEAKQYDL